MHESTGHLHPEPCDVVDRRAATALAPGKQPEHRHAGHVAYDRQNNAPLSNLFVRMLHQMGIEQRAFGASTGVLNAI